MPMYSIQYIEKQGKERQKFPLFYLVNEEIKSEKIKNYIQYFEFSCSGFPCWEYKRVEMSKIILYPIFYTYPAKT